MGGTSERPDAKEVLILCNACTEHFTEGETVAWLHARLGPQGLTEDDVAILCAPSLQHVRPEKFRRAMRMECDKCKVAVYVAPSSQWLLDLRARLRQKGWAG